MLTLREDGGLVIGGLPGGDSPTESEMIKSQWVFAG
jgi:hypothetical protein